MSILKNDNVEFLPKNQNFSTHKKLTDKIDIEFLPIDENSIKTPFIMPTNKFPSKIIYLLENSMALDETIEFDIIYKNETAFLNKIASDSPEVKFARRENSHFLHSNDTESTQIIDSDSQKSKSTEIALSNTDDLTSLKKDPFIFKNQFKISTSLIKTESKGICVLHCFGEIYQSNCLILHQFFKMYLTDPKIYVIVDMAEVTYVENKIWEYFASRALTIQKLNGILIFSGIHVELYSTITDFSKKNIFGCETINSCVCVIKILSLELTIQKFHQTQMCKIQLENQKMRSCHIKMSRSI